MTITYRDQLTRDLTPAEVDANFRHALDGANTTFLQSGIGAIAEDLQSRGRWVVYATDFMTTAQRADVRAFTLLVNVAAAVQAAIDYAFTIGATLEFPAGGYLIGTTTLVLKNKVTYKGAGKDFAYAKGTLIHYTGTSDAIQINNPINSSNSANISIEDLSVRCTVRTAGKAAIADVGSTFLSIKRVQVSGNDYGIILDQSALTDLDECDFEIFGAGKTGGLWLANVADHSPGASLGFTNRISVKRCQFSGDVGTAIIDDGGNVHVYEDNNYNGCARHGHFVGVSGLSIRGGEYEGATGPNFKFSNLTLVAGTAVGSCAGVEIGGGALIVPTAATSAIDIVNVVGLVFGKVTFANNTAAKVSGTANANDIIALGINNLGGGTTFDGLAARHFEINTSIGGVGTAVVNTNMQVRSVSATAGIGYGTGAGGTVTQGAGSGKATGVTLSTITGEITMDGAILNADTTVSFTLTNTAIAAGDHVLVQHVSGGTVGSYMCTAVAAAGSATVVVRNITAGNLTEAPVLKFSVIKAVTA